MGVNDLSELNDKSHHTEEQKNNDHDNGIPQTDTNTATSHSQAPTPFIPIATLLPTQSKLQTNTIQPITAQQSIQRFKQNSLLHTLYIQNNYTQCTELCEELLYSTFGQCEYAIYIKGLIQRNTGHVNEALQLFQAATILNPYNIQNIKQIAKCLFLLGQHQKSIQVYLEAQNIADDWEINYNIAINHIYIQQYDQALQALQAANELQHHDTIFLTMARVYILQNDVQGAIDCLSDALEYSPDSADILTQLGILYLRQSNQLRSFDMLGTALTYNNTNFDTILALGSIVQDFGDIDVALIKYRIAACKQPNNVQLWNNIGVCFYAKQKYVAAISCLKKANFNSLFQWIIQYNLGLTYIQTKQYTSAFNHFTAAIQLHNTYAYSYMYLGIVLDHLDDVDNAVNAFSKAIQLDGTDATIYVNYAALLYNHQRDTEAKRQLSTANEIWLQMDNESRTSEANVGTQIQQLETLLQ